GVDAIAPEVGIDLAPIVIGDDNYLNAAELDDKASVTLHGTVSGDAKVGDTVTLTLPDGSTITTSVAALSGGGLGFTTTTTADHLGTGTPDVKAEITVTDDAGNTASASDTESFQVDTSAPEVGIDLAPIVIGDDNYLNAAELDDKASATRHATVSGDAKVGDTVTLTLPDGSTITTSVVALSGGGLGFTTTTTADHLGTGTPDVKAEITVTDEAGNRSGERRVGNEWIERTAASE